MSITSPEGVIVIGKTIMNAYAALILAILVLGPLILLHGYRVWWVVVIYAAFATGTVGGIFSHYRVVRRDRKS
jgi:sterol desaturase/sphingolipid hydroxylase (fatty acid hydroxylase superfamily)